MLMYCKDDDEASGSQEGSSGGRSHQVEQFTGVGIKVFSYVFIHCLPSTIACDVHVLTLIT